MSAGHYRLPEKRPKIRKPRDISSLDFGYGPFRPVATRFWLARVFFGSHLRFCFPLAVVVGSTFLRPVANLLQNASIHRLVGVQVYRIAGAVFLMSHFWFGSYISREFALQTGWGDVLTGVLALPVAIAAWRRISYWQILVVVWCILGDHRSDCCPAYCAGFRGSAI